MANKSTDGRNTKYREGIPLGKIGGVPIVLAYSWFIIAIFIVISYGPPMQRRFPDLGYGALLLALGYAVLLLLSVLVHELAHALVARAFHWPSTKIVLNLWGGHTQFESFPVSAGKSLVVALSGPAANFVLAGLGKLLSYAVPQDTPTGALLSIFILTNMLVGIFNILPGLPLDGGRIVETIVWKMTGSQDRGTIAAGWTGRIIAVLLALFYLGVPLLRHESLEPSVFIVALLVCGFLWVGASSAIKGAKIRERVPGLSITPLMSPAIGLPQYTSVAQLQRAVPDPGQSAVVLQDEQGQPTAMVDWAAATAVPQQQRDVVSALAVARTLPVQVVLPQWLEGAALIERLRAVDTPHYVIVSPQGRIVGVLGQKDVVKAMTGKG